MRSFVVFGLSAVMLLGMNLVGVEAADGSVSNNPGGGRRRRTLKHKELAREDKERRELGEQRRRLHYCNSTADCPGEGLCNVDTNWCECDGVTCHGTCTELGICDTSCYVAPWVCSGIETCEFDGSDYVCTPPPPGCGDAAVCAVEIGGRCDVQESCIEDEVCPIDFPPGSPECETVEICEEVGFCNEADGCICVWLQQALNGDPYPTGIFDFNFVYPTVPACDCQACGRGCGEMVDDPHVRSWTGEWFDYMGECDLKLVKAPQFDGVHDIDIDVRTKIRYDYSFIEAAAVKIGYDVLEVASWGSYAVNGVEDALNTHSASVPTIGGYPIYHTVVSDKKHTFDIVIADTENITLSTFKDWVSVQMKDKNEQEFAQVSGLMGTYKGQLLSRDGTDMHDDINALAQDWQIKPDEQMLFRTTRAPQAPQKCILPDPNAAQSRRLGQGVLRESAENACAHHKGKGHAFSFCVHDVMATGDLDRGLYGVF